MTTFHNPENLTEDQYGAKEGWRLLLKSEVDMVPTGSEIYFKYSGCWEESCNQGHAADSGSTYRTRAPLPAESDVWIKRSFRAPNASEFPVWYFGRSPAFSKGIVWCGIKPTGDDSWTHWREAEKQPAFPAEEEPTFREDQYWLNRLLEQYHAGEINPQQFINAVSGRVKE